MIMERKIGFMEQQLLTPEMAVINQVLYGLDLVRHRMEMKWGVGRLVELATPELQLKWESHTRKLEGAIMASEVEVVKELVDGGVRGWAALERAAVEGGHVPFEPMVWEVAAEGVVYRVVRGRDDAEALGGDVVTLGELVRVYHLRHQNALIRRPGDEFTGEYKASGLPMEQDIGF